MNFNASHTLLLLVILPPSTFEHSRAWIIHIDERTNWDRDTYPYYSPLYTNDYSKLEVHNNGPDNMKL